MKILLLSTAALCCGGLLLVCGCNATSPTPLENTIVAVPASVELARVAEGAELKAVVQLTNKGKTLVKVANVATSCGCTTSTIASDVLKPGQTVALKVGYNSKGFSGLEEKMIAVSFADGSSDLEIPVRADVYSLVKLSPAEIDFGNARLGQTKTVTVEMKRLDGGALLIPRFDKIREFEIKAERRAANQIALQVTLRPKEFAGSRSHVFELQTGLEELPQMSLPMHAIVRGQFQIEPSQLNFGMVSGSAEKKTAIASRQGAPLPQLRIKSVPPGFAATLNRGKDGYSLVARSNGTAKTGIVNDAVVIQTDDEKEPLIEIPLLAVTS